MPPYKERLQNCGRATFLTLTQQYALAVRLLEEDLLGPAEVEQGLRFISKELAHVLDDGDPRSCLSRQLYWIAYSTTISELSEAAPLV